MRKVICDRCGRDISDYDNTGYISVVWRPVKGPDEMSENPYEDYDFCEDCLKDIVRVIDFKVVAAPEEPENEEPGADPDPEESEVIEKIAQAPAPKKKPIDKGKVGALARAGWPPKKIADEMGVSTQRIGQILREVQQND